MSELFSPFQFRDLTVANRIAVSPMCQYVAVDGRAHDWHRVHLSTLALSGAGMLFIEATAVEPEARITPGDLGLWDDGTEAALRSVLAIVRSIHRVPVIIQLSHAGRKASSHVPWEGGQQIPVSEGGWLTFAPSAVPQIEHETPPQALDAAGLERVLNAFVSAAKRAEALGVDGIELHWAHGYLMHEFMSPISNQRTDQYGGSLENRIRFPLEVFEAVRAAFPAGKPVGVKVSAADWVEGGWDLDQTIAFARQLAKRGGDWITVSSAGVSPKQKITVGPSYQVSFAEMIKRESGLPTIAVGLITDPKQAEEIVAGGKADFVALARGMLYDPRWGWHAAAELGAVIDAPPPSYWRAPPHGHADLFRNTRYGAR